MLSFPQILLKNIINNDTFAKKVLPFVKDEYFEDQCEKQLYSKITSFYSRFNTLPTPTALTLELDQDSNITEDQFKRSGEILDSITSTKTKENDDWLLEQTEKFCKQRSMVNAILSSISVLEDIKNNKGDKELAYIENLVTDALSVSFNLNIGHNYFEDSDARYAEYHSVTARLPFDLMKFNEVSNGGLPKKTLSVIVGGVNVGKSLCLCHFSASTLLAGKNVLYITMELPEIDVAKRIDANLLDLGIDDLLKIPKNVYDGRMSKLKNKTMGKLIVKEYTTGSAHVGHFRHLLGELKLTKNFIPDLICIDYLNIVASSRVKMNAGSMNTATYFKMVSEELRGMAQAFNVPVVTATQLNRAGFSDSDPGMEHIAESFAIAATADWMITIISNEELASKNQYMVKQIKSRLSDATKYPKFFIGVDRNKQRLFDLTDSEANDNSVPDELLVNPAKKAFNKGIKKDFSSFKF